MHPSPAILVALLSLSNHIQPTFYTLGGTFLYRADTPYGEDASYYWSIWAAESWKDVPDIAILWPQPL